MEIVMVSEKILVESALGIHLRPAGAMCDTAIKYESSVTFTYGEGKHANAKSVISILAASVKCGDEIELVADGADEQEALEKVSEAFKEALKD
jgi:phosphocarrier protein